MSLLASNHGAIAGATHLAYADLVMETGPVAWWPLDSNLVDYVGGRNGVIGAGSAVHAGALPHDSGGSFDCAGTNFISVAHDVVLKPAAGSIMAWFRPATVHNGWVLDAGAPGLQDGDFALRVLSGGLVSAYFQSSSAQHEILTAMPYYSVGQTVCAIVAFDSSGFRLYLDGNRIGNDSTYLVGLTGNIDDWWFGTDRVAGDNFHGMIDEIAIWDRVLTRNEVYLLSQTEPD